MMDKSLKSICTYLFRLELRFLLKKPKVRTDINVLEGKNDYVIVHIFMGLHSVVICLVKILQC